MIAKWHSFSVIKKKTTLPHDLKRNRVLFFNFLICIMSSVVELACRFFLSTYKRAKDRKPTGRTSVRYGMKSESQGSVVIGNRKVAGSSSTVDNWCVVLYLHCLSSTSCNGYRLTMGDGLTCDGLVSNSGRVNDSEKDFKGLKNQR